MNKEPDNEIDLPEDRAMLYVPHNALEATLTFKVYLDGEVTTVYTTLTQDELQEAVRKAREGYMDEDDRFVLTDKGREYLESIKEQDHERL